MKTKRWFFVLGAVVLLALLGKGADFYMRHREATLIERANTYWAAVASHDLLTAYHLEAEAASGNLRPDEVDQTRDWNVRIVSFSLGEITYYGHSAEILLSREMTWPATETGKTRKKPPIKDLWTFYDGDWYHGAPEKGGSSIRDLH